MFGFFKKQRREKLLQHPFPAEWLPILEKNVPIVPVVSAGGQEFVADRFRDAKPARGVFTIDHDEIEQPILPQAGEVLYEGGAAAASNDVADEEKTH